MKTSTMGGGGACVMRFIKCTVVLLSEWFRWSWRSTNHTLDDNLHDNLLLVPLIQASTAPGALYDEKFRSLCECEF